VLFRSANAIFMNLDFAWDANTHDFCSSKYIGKD